MELTSTHRGETTPGTEDQKTTKRSAQGPTKPSGGLVKEKKKTRGEKTLGTSLRIAEKDAASGRAQLKRQEKTYFSNTGKTSRAKGTQENSQCEIRDSPARGGCHKINASDFNTVARKKDRANQDTKRGRKVAA